MKEQRPGFTGLVKRVDTVAETRIVGVDLYHGDVLSVGDLQCVLDRFSCIIFIIKRCYINLYWCYVFL